MIFAGVNGNRVGQRKCCDESFLLTDGSICHRKNDHSDHLHRASRDAYQVCKALCQSVTTYCVAKNMFVANRTDAVAVAVRYSAT